MRTLKLASTLTLAGCVGISLLAFKAFTPKGVPVVQNFEQEKYLGTWYEIARLDYRWEKGLEQVTATYTLEKGRIKVDNKGFNVKKSKWVQSIGKAKPVKDPKQGRLKVSFFGPFYSGYNIVALDKDYKYALVIGESKDYMWLLSREKTIPEDIKQEYLKKAKELGVVTENLVWVKH